MRDFLITPTQMLNMLERYAKGGAATMTQVRVNPAIRISDVKQFKIYYFRN